MGFGKRLYLGMGNSKKCPRCTMPNIPYQEEEYMGTPIYYHYKCGRCDCKYDTKKRT